VVNVFLQIPDVLAFALSAFALVLKVFALVDAAVRPAAAFTATSNQSKLFWVGILAAGLVLSLLFLFSPTIIFNLIAVCAAAVYLAGVRPAIKEALGRAGR
jgi:Protein of unknown function (DUF2516)